MHLVKRCGNPVFHSLLFFLFGKLFFVCCMCVSAAVCECVQLICFDWKASIVSLSLVMVACQVFGTLTDGSLSSSFHPASGTGIPVSLSLLEFRIIIRNVVTPTREQEKGHVNTRGDGFSHPAIVMLTKNCLCPVNAKFRITGS